MVEVETLPNTVFFKEDFMGKKNVCMDIKADQFEVLENDEAMCVDGGIDSPRQCVTTIIIGIIKIINYF